MVGLFSIYLATICHPSQIAARPGALYSFVVPFSSMVVEKYLVEGDMMVKSVISLLSVLKRRLFSLR